MDVCCCLQTCNSVENVLAMWLVLGQSLMVISTMGILLYAKVSPLYVLVKVPARVLYGNYWARGKFQKVIEHERIA